MEEIHLHKSSGVCDVRASAVPELCLLEDQDPRNDAGQLVNTALYRAHFARAIFSRVRLKITL